jgi:hypothetical protein
MKKLTYISLIFATILCTNIGYAGITLKTHCLFMTYNYSFWGTQHQGSGFYCIEWFWRIGQQPEVGEETQATLSSKDSTFEIGEEIEIIKDQIIVTTFENISVRMKLPKGKYRVNDEGKINCKAIIID